MPRPQHDGLNDRSTEQPRKALPCAAKQFVVTQFPGGMPPRPRQCPQENCEWLRERDQGCGEEHEQFMLDHVRGKRTASEFMQRCQRREGKRQPCSAK